LGPGKAEGIAAVVAAASQRVPPELQTILAKQRERRASLADWEARAPRMLMVAEKPSVARLLAARPAAAPSLLLSASLA